MLHKALRARCVLGAGDAVGHGLAVGALGAEADLDRQLWVCSAVRRAAQQCSVDGVEQLSQDLCGMQVYWSSSRRTPTQLASQGIPAAHLCPYVCIRQRQYNLMYVLTLQKSMDYLFERQR